LSTRLVQLVSRGHCLLTGLGTRHLIVCRSVRRCLLARLLRNLLFANTFLDRANCKVQSRDLLKRACVLYVDGREPVLLRPEVDVCAAAINDLPLPLFELLLEEPLLGRLAHLARLSAAH